MVPSLNYISEKFYGKLMFELKTMKKTFIFKIFIFFKIFEIFQNFKQNSVLNNILKY